MSPATPPTGSHRSALAALGLTGPAAAAIEAYLDLLAAWSLRSNLTGARTADERASLLVAPALPLAPLVEPGGLLDVGSGNGSPGLVVAVLRPDVAVALLEPRQRRWAFLREAARAAGRPDVEVVRARHDTYAGPPAANLTLRALDLPLRELAGLVAPGGQVLALGARLAAEPPFVREESLPGRGLPITIFRKAGAAAGSGAPR